MPVSHWMKMPQRWKQQRENNKFACCCSITAVFRHLITSLATLPPSARNVLKYFKPSWSNHALHSTCSFAIIVVGALWDSCRTNILLIDGKILIKPKIICANCQNVQKEQSAQRNFLIYVILQPGVNLNVWPMLGVSAPRGTIHGQYADGSVIVTQQYYDSAIETNSSKTETVKVTQRG